MDHGFTLATVYLFVIAVALLAAGILMRSKNLRLSNVLLAVFCVTAFLCTAMTINMFRVIRAEALYLAAGSGNVEEVRRLLKEGADPEAEWESGETALHAAEANGHKEVVKLLKDAGARR